MCRLWALVVVVASLAGVGFPVGFVASSEGIVALVVWKVASVALFAPEIASGPGYIARTRTAGGAGG